MLFRAEQPRGCQEKAWWPCWGHCCFGFDTATRGHKDAFFALSSRGDAKRRLGDLAGAIAALDLTLQLEATKMLFCAEQPMGCQEKAW